MQREIHDLSLPLVSAGHVDLRTNGDWRPMRTGVPDTVLSPPSAPVAMLTKFRRRWQMLGDIGQRLSISGPLKMRAQNFARSSFLRRAPTQCRAGGHSGRNLEVPQHGSTPARNRVRAGRRPGGRARGGHARVSIRSGACFTGCAQLDQTCVKSLWVKATPWVSLGSRCTAALQACIATVNARCRLRGFAKCESHELVSREVQTHIEAETTRLPSFQPASRRTARYATRPIRGAPH